ncbi:autotransporter domain-containing protein [Bradyrhizobium sp. UFLA05-109]
MQIVERAGDAERRAEPSQVSHSRHQALACHTGQRGSLRGDLLITTLIAALGLALTTTSSRAQNWTGAAGTTDWNTAGNWDNNAVPNGTTDANIDTITPNPTAITIAGAAVNSVAVGVNGSGMLTISGNGTLVSSSSTAWNFIGYNANSIGTVTVTGSSGATHSSWTINNALIVGNSATGTPSQSGGTLTISNGGTVTNVDAAIGYNTGATGTATVDGTGSSWTSSGNFAVGYSGAGTLRISNGGTVTSATATSTGAYIGYNAGSTGSVTVDGTGSSWTNSGYLFVGVSGTGALTIKNGGTVTSRSAAIGYNSTGSATVDGSSWTDSGNLFVGYNSTGKGTLTISNGGTVTDVQGIIGWNSAGPNNVSVTGAGSTWTSSSNLAVGQTGTGTLMVGNGGAVISNLGLIGNNSGSTGFATVDGLGSSWTSSNLAVGNDGTGTLTISNGGTVNAGGTMSIANGAGSTGTLNIGAAAGQAPTGAGTLNAPLVTFGAGTGMINFNHTDPAYTFASTIQGFGTLNQLAGNTILTADSSGFTGPTNITGGRLAVNGSIANSLVTVSNGGILGGNGTVGSVVASAGGIIAPGNSIGTLTINGNLSQASGSIYQVELTSTGQNDRINATGTATIANGATLNVVKLDAAPYVIGTHYTVLQANGGVSGTYTLTGDTKLSTFIGLVDHYDPTHVYLDVVQTKSFASIGLTPNQKAAGAGAESLGTGNPIYTAIAWLPTDGAAQHAFDQLSGEIHASAKTALVEDSRFVRDAMNDRLRSAFDAVGAVSTPVMSYASGGPEYVPATTDRFALWGRAFGSWGHTESDGNAARLNRSTGGIFVGGDGRVLDTWRLGLLGGYSQTNFNVRDRASSGTSDNYHLGLYGGTEWGNLAFRTGAAYTWHNLSTSRFVTFPGFSDSLAGKYDAGTVQAFGELAYGMRAGTFGFEPFANLAYVDLHTDGFRETGHAAALSNNGGSSDATFSTLGLRTSTSFMLGGVNATARGTLGWRHAFGDVTPLSTVALAGGAPFTIAGVPIAKNSAVVEAGLDFAIAPSATLGVSYSGQFASSVSDQSVRANFNWKF